MNSSMDLLSKTLIFATGAAIGSVVAWYLTKKKYEPDENWIIDEETEEVPIDEPKREEKKDTTEQNMVQYNKYVKSYSSDSVSEPKVEKKEEVNEYVDRPYHVSVSDFGEMDGYNTVSLYYYEDHVLTDELGNAIDDDDVDELIGLDNLKKFDEDPEWDSCYIRNDTTRTDYEILRDMGCYYPVTKE